MPEYLAKGTFGCVLYPAIPCKYNRENEDINIAKSVSKVFSKHTNLSKELNLHRKAIQADPNQLFTLPPPRKCRFDKQRLNNVRNFDNCNLSISDTSHEQLVFEYGGYDLLNIPSNYTFYEIFPYFVNILFGVVLMDKNNMIHSDIKPLNILFCPLKEQMYLIDFGLLNRKDTFYNQDNQFILSHKYLFYPPEFKMYNIRKASSLSEFLERNCYQRYFKEREHLLRDAYYKIREQLNHSEDIDGFFNKNMSNKIDVYAVGMVIHYCFLRYNDGSFDDSIIDQFVFRLTHPDPYKRVSPENALIEMQKTLTKLEPKMKSPELKRIYRKWKLEAKKPIVSMMINKSITSSMTLDFLKRNAKTHAVSKDIIDTDDYDEIYNGLHNNIKALKQEKDNIFTKRQLQCIAEFYELPYSGTKEEIVKRIASLLRKRTNK